MTFTAKPEKAAQLQNCLFNPQDYCITLQPGESGCIISDYALELRHEAQFTEAS
jgi:hypothetical protein